MKRIIKTTIEVIIFVLLCFFIYNNRYYVTTSVEYIYKKFLQGNIIQTLYDNEYRKKQNYEYIKINEDTTIRDKKDIINAIYTYLDAGWDTYTVKCDVSYQNCLDDFKQITNDNSLLTKINTYVHPFNTFKNLKISFSAIGRITLKKEAYYTRNQIEEINQKVDEIYNKLYDTSKTPRENIKIFHDYLINNTKYDKNNTTGSPNMISSNAYGVFTKGLGICNAYTDAMSLFLEKMKIKNYRIASNTHIWNFVYLEGNWYHLDLTFDDVIMYDDSEKLVYDYFLITNNELEQFNDEDHVYDKYTYIEAQ